MPLNRPTLLTLIDRIAGDVTSSLTGASTLALRSVLRVFVRVVAGAIHLVYGYIDNLTEQLFIKTASSSYLDQIGSEYGVNRTAAAKAAGITTATGTNGSIIPIGTELQNTTGYVYTTDVAVTITAGTALLAITASVAGVASNDVAGASLTLTSPIIGVNTATTVDSNAVSNGADEETDMNYRTRLLARKSQPPHGGSNNDYIMWAKEVAGVTRAWVQEQYQGVGTLALYFVRDGDTNIFPGGTEIATVTSYITQHTNAATGQVIGLPVTALPGFFVFAPTQLTVDFNIGIYPNTSAVQTAIRAELVDLFLREGGPGKTIYLSQIREAISLATGEERHRLNSPVVDSSTAYNELQIVGTITFGAF